MSKNVLIIGATGSLGRALTQTLLEETDAHLTLFSRSADCLSADDSRVKKISASVFDRAELKEAVTDQDVIFAALSGDLPAMAQAIIEALDNSASQRLVFISSYGIYGELPGQNGRVDPVLRSYRQAADIVEASNVNYTILRPGWFDNSNDLSYELFPKGETIYGNAISRRAIAQCVKTIVEDPALHSRANLGIVR
ncbi:NAD-dependent epimerase/dehydratase family protein [Streptococcus chenjunshii]|uniref:NAD-dependent epimerase/dehydratase family protein n=1 Tax=Streptococcus chenjunshii TaxID=2173853 RepID=A0A372KN05_9STRE|nr:NAD(P)H-binding protein [Streptococcus chenjunshii]AXQ78791.1 NAD-dependent epimerase/dehydratase family protein [Streptococcus chenjunshii]RFU51552.1 NAD-dependent epimerase/dehydratase family protein [Streptococcus chenjunshii]RFU53672.1 NAD-dependent epimerase/dehydratase family protein [Streptococcus chenjunshii]